MNAVAARLGPEIDHRQTNAFGFGIEYLVRIGQTNGHGVDQYVAIVAFVEVHLATHRRHAEAIAITANAGDYAGHKVTGLGMLRCAETQRVEGSDRACSHGEHIPQDAADPGAGPLIRLDK